MNCVGFARDSITIMSIMRHKITLLNIVTSQYAVAHMKLKCAYFNVVACTLAYTITLYVLIDGENNFVFSIK